MYPLKALHQLPSVSPPSQESVTSSLTYIEERQDKMLVQLGVLEAKVNALGEKLGVSCVNVSRSKEKAAFQDVVVSCPPSCPPYALLTLSRLINQQVSVAFRVHLHSSLLHTHKSSTKEELLQFFEGVKPDNSINPSLRLTLIWKSEVECTQPTMIVSPHNQTPVQGITNILRYLCRQFSPDLYEGRGIDVASLIDSWLDCFAGFQHWNTKEKSRVTKQLNAQLGFTPFLVGDKLSLADIVGFGVVSNDSVFRSTENIMLWLKRCQQLPAFAAIPCSF